MGSDREEVLREMREKFHGSVGEGCGERCEEV